MDNAARLAQMRAAKIERVQILFNHHEGCYCSKARLLQDEEIPIDKVPSLPLDGCDADECGCIWTALI